MQDIMEELGPVEPATLRPKFTENITVHEVRIPPTRSPLSQKKVTVHSKFERNIPTQSPTSQNNMTVQVRPTKIPPTRSNKLLN